MNSICTRTMRLARPRLMPLYLSLLLALVLASPSGADTIVNSRLGKLEFTSGYPTKETASRLYDELDFQRAVQIYLWADSPERAFVAKTSAATLVLLGFLILMNGLAVLLRKKFERRW